MKEKEFTNKYAEQIVGENKHKYKIFVLINVISLLIYVIGFWLLIFKPFGISPWFSIFILTLNFFFFTITNAVKTVVLTKKQTIKAWGFP